MTMRRDKEILIINKKNILEKKKIEIQQSLTKKNTKEMFDHKYQVDIEKINLSYGFR